MFAIVEIAGKQYKVQKDQQLYVDKLNGNAEDTMNFDNVLLVDTDGKVQVGTPHLSGASVSAKVIDHVKGDKVIVFKKKRRKGYVKRNGHRQEFTKIKIDSIKA